MSLLTTILTWVVGIGVGVAILWEIAKPIYKEFKKKQGGKKQ